ncbi:MAG: hypothetical protein WBB85_02790 [Albidovulum sp.]|uniref:hypothetical protein n=1 Tax=Albidovulum sp. TaxID=1872424 RepID=UPI003C87E521
MKLLLLASMLAAGSAAAQEANQVVLDATYLGAPTEWCPADAGVPLVVKMDGPDIVEGPKAWPRTVKVNRGGNLQIVHTGENTASFNRVEDFGDEEAEVIGRFSADFRTCLSAWSSPRLTGTWSATATDGAELGSGTFENDYYGNIHLPFFRSVSGPSEAHYATFGDRKFFTAGRPETKITQTFAAEPDKE